MLAFTGFPSGSAVKNLSAMLELWAPSLVWEDSLKEEMATHSGVLRKSHGERSLVSYSP